MQRFLSLTNACICLSVDFPCNTFLVIRHPHCYIERKEWEEKDAKGAIYIYDVEKCNNKSYCVPSITLVGKLYKSKDS